MTAEPAKFVSRSELQQPPTPDVVQAVPPDSSTLVPVPVDMRNAAVTVLAIIASILVLQYAQSVFIPLILGLLISYALDPIVSRFDKWGLKRVYGAALVLLLLVGGGTVLLYQLRSQAEQIIEQLPDGARRLREILEQQQGHGGAIDKVQQAATELQKAASDPGTSTPTPGVTKVQVEDSPVKVSDYLMWGSVNAATAVGQAVLILFLAYFLMASGDLYRRKLVKIVGPSLTKKKITVQILQEIDRQIESFLLVQVFTSAVVGVATWLAFTALGLQQAAVWGLLAGIFNSIPYVGPILVSGCTAIVAFLQFGTLSMTLKASSVALVITSLEGFLLTPWLTSRAARMNAVAVFVGLLFWGWVWNVWGMLLAVPMLMVVKAVCDHVEDFKGVGELLGD
jgi:predicted PurR-regulated permease PerM